MATMKRSVVSCFIIKDYLGKAQVAMFRRSGKVRTYPHQLGAISGSVDKEDASPLATAWRELEEETTLTSKSLALIRQGKPYIFVDDKIGREWTIYPFAFQLKTVGEGGAGEAGIQIDWEHESWGWYNPMEVEDTPEFGGVPRIAESLRRVWFEKDIGETPGKILRDGLKRLQTDQSGEQELAGLALEILRDVVREMDSSWSWDQWWSKTRFVAWHIWKNGRDSMEATIKSVLLSTLADVEKIVSDQVDQGEQVSSATMIATAVEELTYRTHSRQSDPARLVPAALEELIFGNL
ncbi:uncharacterized protein TRIVIDRAFT_110531 [Trichoderma virens Gv29-8]|uniref:Nudix hydrolase domain-containing protein n=1 Tax=Hypocrea virens (strain Gv29-8 / FGSC 10586) TaxID=413071 RepID=G9MSV9_HYPVG|nr:uncharacterized protein TRIVIDRAFT_110531 [Trichoderma virens Gv29-8]EHK23056.1 hypothetical protein TRIVIDRAFT_110531 [Trichoderma virens Gv29-8]UKZ48116.1 hypothetical protein TrVGV298_002352 [Trichoderma virens]